MVLTVHWATPYLGAERFGIWATFGSLAAMLSFLDLGVGNALINRVAQAAANDDPSVLRSVVTGGTGWLALIGLVTAAVLAVAAVTIPWGTLFKLSNTEVAEEARLAAITFSIFFGVNLFSTGLSKLLVGQQRSHEANVLSVIGALLSCLALWWACTERIGVAGLLIAGFGVRALAGLAVLPVLSARGQFTLLSLGSSMRSERNVLLKTGSLFFLLQIGMMVGWSSDSFVLASLAGAEQVAVLAIAQRLFLFASQPIVVMNAPLWAAYADAFARNDRAFVRTTLRRSALISVGCGGALAFALALLGPWVIPHWTQGAVTVPWTLLALLALWTTIEAGGSAFATYLNAAGIVREQVVVVILFCVVALPLKVFAATEAGASGLVAGTIIAYLVTNVCLFLTVYRSRVLAPLVGAA